MAPSRSSRPEPAAVVGAGDGALRRVLGSADQGACGELALAVDWAATTLGEPARWPPALGAVISAALGSRFPMLVMAGPDLEMVYNDAYAVMLGPRHPGAMGRRLADVWSDVWPTIAPMITEVRDRRQANHFEDLMLVVTRYGFDEETYFTFSYSPLLDPDGGSVHGLLNTAMETTGRVLAGRRLVLAQRLGETAAVRHATLDAACRALVATVAEDRPDIPCAAVYLLDDPARVDGPLRLRAGHGVTKDVGRPGSEGEVWLREAMRSGAQTATGLATRWHGLAPAPEHVGSGPVDTAVALPLTPAGSSTPVGVLFAGVSPHLRFDGPYQTFLELVAAQLAGALADTYTHLAEQAAAEADRSMSETLQRSLLSDPVVPDDLEIITRYLPAAVEAEIGGDWYDAFLCQNGSTWLVVGDVAGHDTAAAACMAQVRNLLRGIAYTQQESPSVVLSALDRAMAGLGVRALTSVVAMRIDQDDADAARGIRRVRWSNAGHPPPLFLAADGGTRLLDGVPERMLGVDPHSPRSDREVVLVPGDGLLLYTDGLIERRTADLDAGTGWLLDTVGRHAGGGLEQLCDHLIAEIHGRAEDDVVLLALRAHPQPGDHAPG